MNEERPELGGLRRTTCGCRKCTIPCEAMPGSLVPSDVPRIMAALGYRPGEEAKFARENLLASEGSLVLEQSTGRRYRVATITPAQKPDGSCKFLTEDKRCAIHAVSPAGCAYADTHVKSEFEEQLLSNRIVSLQKNDPTYAWLHSLLWGEWRRAKPLEVRRAKVEALWKKEGFE